MITVILFNLAIIGFLLVVYVRKTFRYWSSRGFPEIKPVIPFGCMWPFLTKEKSAGCAIGDAYFKSSDAVVGVYVWNLPQLIIRDVEILRRIMITDFHNFIDRHVYINSEKDPTSQHLFSQRGDEWKTSRSKLSTFFTRSKLRCMFPTFQAEIVKLDRYIEQSIKESSFVDLRETINHYMLNVIASVFFGLDIDTSVDSSHPFKRMYLLTSRPPNFLEVFRQSSMFLFPE